MQAQFSPKGYPGKVRVTIAATDSEAFDTYWEKPDPSRFPRRIRAATYALLSTRYFSTFEIQHDRKTGLLTVAKQL